MAALSLHNWFGAKLPSFARDFLFRSMAWYEKGHFQEALSDIDRSLELDPGDATALDHRGNVLAALNRLEEAREAYGAALIRSPDEAGIWNNLGATLAALGRPGEALPAFRKATECEPPSTKAFLGIAFLQIHSGRLDEAAATLDRLDRVERSADAAALATRSVLARLRGDAIRADALEQQARRLDADATAWAIERAGNAGP